MTLTYKVGGVTLSNRVQLTNGSFVTAADQGTLGSGSVQIEDIDSSLTINGWQTFTVDDSQASPTRVFTGYIVDRQVGRNSTFQTGSGRVHDCTILDLNALLHMKLNRYVDNDAKRPQETDTARTAWLLTSRALSGIVYDEGLVSTAHQWGVLAADCRDRYADDVLSELSPVTNKNYYVYHDAASGNPALAYALDLDAYWAATLSIANDGTANGSTIFAPSADALLTKSPQNEYSGVDYQWLGGTTWVESATIQSAIGFKREAVYNTNRIGKATTALSAAKNWLNARSGEEQTLAVTIRVPSGSVNYVYAGQEISVTLTHLDGFTSGVTCRVRRKDARVVGPGTWDLHLELWVPKTTISDAAQNTSPTIVQMVTGQTDGATGNAVTFANPVTAGNLLLVAMARRCNGSSAIDTDMAQINRTNSAGPARSFTNVGLGNGGSSIYGQVRSGDIAGPDASGIGYRTATGDEQTLYFVNTSAYFTFYELANADITTSLNLSESYQSSATSKSLGAFSTPGDIEIAVFLWDTGDPGASNTQTVGTGWTQNQQNLMTAGHPGSLEMYSTSGATPQISGTAYEWGAVAIAFGSATAPKPITTAPIGSVGSTGGSTTGGETAGGTTNASNTAFTTAYPYIAGTLRVYQDGLDQTDHVSAYDETAGTFTLDYAPRFGAVIKVEYESQ